ncbi:FAD-binding protein, partial [Nocardioides sp.]|uniref:FAD-binding protein n=1 Tax=Nocardioides sp. TaxID=35761 RepID=UPI002732E3F4
KVWPFREQAKPAPRGHKVPVPGDTEGTRVIMDLLRRRIEEAGVDVRYETGANALVRNEQTGAVVGVGWRRFAESGLIAAGSVVLAAGGFVMNPDMVAAHTPRLAEKPFVLGSTYDDGLGIRLGESVGAATAFMEEPFITAPFYPPSSLVKGILVNKRGERFVAEDSYHSRTCGYVMEQPDSAAYLIVDSEHIEHPAFPLAPFIDGWETVEEMEEGLGLPTGSLAKTLDRYNEHAARGEDPDFHKHPDWLAPQATGPWGAYDLTLGTALYAGFTLGGLVTTVDGQVRTEDGSVVPGLYAAGACASNIAQDGKGYASGTQLGEGSFFGRRAGRHAASAASR